MSSPRLVLILLLLVVSATAQLMPDAEYQNSLKRIDADIPRWQKQLSAFDVESLPVSNAEGIKASQYDLVKDLDSIHEMIGQELIRRSLSTEIKLTDRLWLASQGFTGLS